MSLKVSNSLYSTSKQVTKNESCLNLTAVYIFLCKISLRMIFENKISKWMKVGINVLTQNVELLTFRHPLKYYLILMQFKLK